LALALATKCANLFLVLLALRMALPYHMFDTEAEGKSTCPRHGLLGGSLLLGLLCVLVLIVRGPPGWSDSPALPVASATADDSSAVALVEKAFAAWSKGGDFSGFCSEDVVLDMTGVDVPEMNEIHRGRAEYKSYMDWFLSAWKVIDVSPGTASAGPLPGQVYWPMNMTLAWEKTNRSGCADGMYDIRVSKGQITYMKWYWSHPDAMNKAVKPDDGSAVAFVNEAFLASSKGWDAFLAYCSEDFIVDMEGPDIPEMNKLYRGKSEYKSFMGWLMSTFAFKDVIPAAPTAGPSPGQVYWPMNITWESTKTKKSCLDDGVYDVRVGDDKITYMKWYWGRPRCVAESLVD